MIRARWVIPSVDKVWRDECWATLHPDIRKRTTIIDNGEHNCGVATSWNLGAVQAEAEGARWLVICSETMRFGPTGGSDFEDRLTGPWADCGHNWHLIAFAMDTLREVGPFDETFWPIYFEDADYERRLELAGFDTPRGVNRTRVPLAGIDARAEASGHSLTAGFVSVNMGIQAARYRTKWGGEKGAETYATPYGNPDLTVRDVTVGEDHLA